MFFGWVQSQSISFFSSKQVKKRLIGIRRGGYRHYRDTKKPMWRPRKKPPRKSQSISSLLKTQNSSKQDPNNLLEVEEDKTRLQEDHATHVGTTGRPRKKQPLRTMSTVVFDQSEALCIIAFLCFFVKIPLCLRLSLSPIAALQQ